MNRGDKHSRRKFLGGIATAGLLAVGAAATLSGCGRKEQTASGEQSVTDETVQPVSSCDDLTGVSEQDLGVRKKLGYVEKSPIADNQCHNCNLFLPPKPDHKCGGCMLFKGPVFTDAYCTYWAPKV